MLSPTALIPLASLLWNTPLTSPPICWSSTLTQVRKVLPLLWKMHRPPCCGRCSDPLVVEDAATLKPVYLHTSDNQVLVARHD